LQVLFDAAPDELWGYEISRETALKGGSLYPVFRRLEDAALAESRWEADETAESEARPRRRYYKLTPAGLAYCQEVIVSTSVPGLATGEPA
jgi:PadR family transcriptional regulator PadR